MDKHNDKPVIIQLGELKEIENQKDEYEERLNLYNEVLKHVESFLTFWYEHTEEFGKIRDDFNEIDEFPAKLLLKDGRIKIKINQNEEN